MRTNNYSTIQPMYSAIIKGTLNAFQETKVFTETYSRAWYFITHLDILCT